MSRHVWFASDENTHSPPITNYPFHVFKGTSKCHQFSRVVSFYEAKAEQLAHEIIFKQNMTF